jgi:sterol desaturase/sphingolipid hydroxylase (fatty acid hydroxylase superfamily)
MRTPIAVLAGAASWTGAEYGLHRFLMHEMKGRGIASREHLRHHAEVDYFAPASKKAASAAGATAVVLPIGWAVAGRRTAVAYTSGLIGMYLLYEAVHRRIHTHPPRTGHGRAIRKLHLQHHAGSPMRNFGVTSAVWDRVFGTLDQPATVTLPRRIAPAWLLDADDEVRPELRGDYEVRGSRRSTPEVDARDHELAFANLPPEI